MSFESTISPSYDPLSQYAPYSSSISTSASASTASIWSGSDTASQASDDTSVSTTSSDNDSCLSYFSSRESTDKQVVGRRLDVLRQQRQQQQQAAPVVPVELRQNPRRTAAPSGNAGCPPPTLVRQSDRKVNFVDSLVAFTVTDSSTQIVEAIWPLSSAPCRPEPGNRTVLPLRTFIQETLRRSRTSYSTLQVALYYLILIKPHVPKRSFTVEQYEDRYADRALQCGRRMFLAALILASKYLQDRNYSARAWSKISGLNVQEINQNEVAFLLAVNWKLHITDEVFQRWTEIVLKHTPPPPPPSPGAVSQALARQTSEWKQLILKLNPDLTNIEGLLPALRLPARSSDLCAQSPRSILNLPTEQQRQAPTTTQAAVAAAEEACERYCARGMLPLEPLPTLAAFPFTPARLPSVGGLLPTPRLTPQSSGICTPAVSAASHLLGKSNAMGLAMAQASNVSTVQHLDRFPATLSTSPLNYCPARRSSLANSISTMSSPESMVSDFSQTSRSSSISSASSFASATLNGSLTAQSRFRSMKAMNERSSLRTTIPTVSESYEEYGFTSSPESYTGPVTKIGDLSLETPLARQERELQGMSRDPASDAARALQHLHNQSARGVDLTPIAPKTGIKRSRTASVDQPLQDHVREMLHAPYVPGSAPWPIARSRALDGSEPYFQVPVRPNPGETRKRLCCSAEAASGYQAATSNHAYGLREPSFWGILN
ncbi:g1 s-specific cyclin pcl5 [Trichoderma arundinaceum]|uniref:G1 s-specific cyclin pcl5 n=1 Tax=Trichoderma arundinaceum TaxID=490622 RepID=A0A395NGK8_TRIAR|nr:g1 s-specific cyclin pcl5 [Trichoderma arundinaceum]